MRRQHIQDSEIKFKKPVSIGHVILRYNCFALTKTHELVYRIGDAKWDVGEIERQLVVVKVVVRFAESSRIRRGSTQLDGQSQ